MQWNGLFEISTINMSPYFFRTAKSSHLEINENWVSKYDGDELGKVYDCYTAKISKEHSHVDKIHHRCDVLNIDNDNEGATVQ